MSSLSAICLKLGPMFAANLASAISTLPVIEVIMELFFLLILIVIMATALGSGYPVAFALPGSAIITIVLAAISGYAFEGDVLSLIHI